MNENSPYLYDHENPSRVFLSTLDNAPQEARQLMIATVGHKAYEKHALSLSLKLDREARKTGKSKAELVMNKLPFCETSGMLQFMFKAQLA